MWLWQCASNLSTQEEEAGVKFWASLGYTRKVFEKNVGYRICLPWLLGSLYKEQMVIVKLFVTESHWLFGCIGTMWTRLTLNSEVRGLPASASQLL